MTDSSSTSSSYNYTDEDSEVTSGQGESTPRKDTRRRGTRYHSIFNSHNIFQLLYAPLKFIRDGDEFHPTSGSLASDTGYESSESNSEITSQATRRKLRRKISVVAVGGDNSGANDAKLENNSVDAANNINIEDSSSSDDDSSDETDDSGTASSHSSRSSSGSESSTDHGRRRRSDSDSYSKSSDSDEYETGSSPVALTKEDLGSGQKNAQHDESKEEDEGSDEAATKGLQISLADPNNSESNDTGKEKYYSDSSAVDAFTESKAREPETAYLCCCFFCFICFSIDSSHIRR